MVEQTPKVYWPQNNKQQHIRLAAVVGVKWCSGMITLLAKRPHHRFASFEEIKSI